MLDYDHYKESRDRCMDLLSNASEKFSACHQVSDNDDNLQQTLVDLQVCTLL